MGLAASALVYAAVTALLFRRLLPDLATHLYSDLGDPLLNASILAWNATRVPLTEAWWNFPAFAPLTGVTAFTEHLLLTYPVASPIIWLTGNPVLAYNVVFLAATPLNGVAAYALGRALTGSNTGGFITGLAFAFAPYQSVHLSHLQHMTIFGMPFGLLWLHRYFQTGRRSALVWFGVGWFMATLANSALLFFFPLLVLLWSAWFVRPHEWRRLIGPAVAAVVASLPLVPLLWGYHERQVAYAFARTSREIQSFSADMVGLIGMYHRAASWRGVLPHDFEEGALFPGFATFALALVAVVAVTQALSGSAGRGFSASAKASARPRHSSPEASDGGMPRPGGPQGPALQTWSRRLLQASALLTTIVLARVWTGPWGWHIGPVPLPPFRPYRLFTVAAVLLVAGVLLTGAFRRAWARRDIVIGCAALVTVLWLTALGPEPEWSTPWRALVYGPYRLLIELPGVDSIRVPARAWFPAVLCLAVLAGFGATAVARRYLRHGRTVIAMGAVLIVTEGAFDDRTVQVPRPMRPGAIPAGALVLDLPMEQGYWNALPQYRAVVGGYRTINGYSGYEPGHFLPLRRAIADMRPDALDGYLRTEDLYVVLRPGLDPDVARWLVSRPGAVHLFDLDAGRIYRLPKYRLDPIAAPGVGNLE